MIRPRVDTRLLIGILLAAGVLGCQSPGSARRDKPSESAELIEWPRSQDPSRIRFLRSVEQPQDYGIVPSLWKRLGRLFLGKEPEELVRPTGVAADGAVLYVADPGARALWKFDSGKGQFRRIQEAGDDRFVLPVAVCLGPGASLYLADSYLAKIWRLDDEGEVELTIAGLPLVRPAGLAYDAKNDHLYVADSGAHRVWRFSGDGKQLGAIGYRGAGEGEFNFPTHVALDSEGRLYVTDALGFRVQFFSADGAFLGLIGRHGDSSGDFAMPKGVAVDSEDHLYIADALFDAVQLFDREGRYLLAFGERGYRSGQFWLPTGVFIDARDRIYVADSYNKRIQIFQYLAAESGS